MARMHAWQSVTTAAWHTWIVPRRLAWVIRTVTAPLYGFHRVDAITISHTTLFLSGVPPLDLERHELDHVCACAEYEIPWWPRWLGRTWTGTVRYGAAYMLEYLRHGYENNRFEVRARAAAAPFVGAVPEQEIE